MCFFSSVLLFFQSHFSCGVSVICTPYIKWSHFKDSKTRIFRGSTLTTLHTIHPSNVHDYIVIWETCFYTNITTNLRTSDCSDPSESCDDPGSVSSCKDPQHWHCPQYMCQPDPVVAWLSTIPLIWVKRSLIRLSPPVSRQCHGVCHTLGWAHTAAAGCHGNTQTPCSLRQLPSQLNYSAPKILRVWI